MKQQHDKKHQELTFEEGDWVWLRLHHRNAVEITELKQAKLYPHFYGPYQVLGCIGSVTYHLQLPAKAFIHDVFLVSMLKKFEGSPPDRIVPLPPIQHGRVILTLE
jgi:hypothetical protein